MPSVLIAGCGYVGTAAAKLFANAGWNVLGWRISSDQPVADKRVFIDTVDLSDAESVRRARFQADVVVHCAGVARRDPKSYRRIYYNGVSNLAQSFPRARLLFTSSTSVYAQTDGSWVDEGSPTEPQSENARILLQAEEVARTQGGIVLRLGGIYGPGRSFLLQAVIERALPPQLDRFVNQIHREDAAGAIFFLAEREPATRGEIFNVVDGTPVLRCEILNWLSQQLSVSPAPSSSPREATPRLKSNKRVSNAKLRRLGWAPAYADYRDAFRESIFPSVSVAPSDLLRGKT